MSFVNGLIVNVGVPLLCVGVAFLAAMKLGHAQAKDNAEANSPFASSSPVNSKTEEVVSTVDELETVYPTKSKKKRNRRKSKSNVSSKTSSRNESDNESAEDEGEPGSIDGDDDDALIRLAVITGTAKPGNIVKKAPVLQEIALHSIVSPAPNVSEDSDWKRIPTRMEEIVGGLKQRVDQLTKQLHEQEETSGKERGEQEKEQRRWKESEHDWRERVKALCQQISNLENEMTGLRASNQYLTEQCATLAELEWRAERLGALAEQNEALGKQISELETLARDTNAAHERSLSVTGQEKQKFLEDLSRAQQELIKSKQLADALNAQLSEIPHLKASIGSMKAKFANELEEKIAMVTELRNRVTFLEGENVELNSQLTDLNSTNQHLTTDFSTVSAEASMLKDAYTINNHYIQNLMESDQRAYQEKSKLVQELVSVKRQLAAMLQ